MSSGPPIPDPQTGVPFATVAVVGLGVMGGSLARALSALSGGPLVVGWSADDGDSRAAANQGGIHRRATSLEECVDGADLVVLAVPVDATCTLLGHLEDLTPSHTVVHDVASLKAPIRDAARAANLTPRWVGGHPMAGAEASGFGGSREDLYRDARVWITPEPDTAPMALEGVMALWRALGARPDITDPDGHDAAMSMASHLPQLTANLLVRVLAEAGLSPGELGPGGRDATRLAGSSPEMWMEILRHGAGTTGSGHLARGLRALAGGASHLADVLDSGDLTEVKALMEETRAWRREP